MKTLLSCVITGTICAIAGGALGYKIASYIKEREIQSMKDTYFADRRHIPYARFAEDKGDAEKPVVEEEKPEFGDRTNLMDYYKQKPKKTENTSRHFMASDNPSESSGAEKKYAPEVIPPEEFADTINDDGWTHVSLTYFDDGVLTDDNFEEVDDVDEKIGNDFASHFGEYDDDVVYIRNFERRTDYEIVRDERRLDNVLANRPKPVEFT